MQPIHHEFAVSATEPVFAGHFPNHPILPGVMLLALARGAVAAQLGRTPRLLRIVRQRFLRPVLPDTTLRVECQLKLDAKQDAEHSYRVACRWLLPDGALVARGELVMA